MEQEKKKNKERLILFLKNIFENNGGTPEDQETLRKYLTEPGSSKTIKYLLWEHWDLTGLKPVIQENFDSERILEKIHHKLHIKEWEQHKHAYFIKNAYHKFSQAAAILLLPVIILSFWYFLNKEHTTNYENISVAEIHSPFGARTHFELPDGSSGWLNAGSTLTFPVRFTGRKRMVSLEGEGFFDVKKNPKRPFIVKTGHFNVMALGTQFNIQNYDNDHIQVITLESGKVALDKISNDHNPVRVTNLKPGEQVIIHKNTGKIQKKKVNPADYSSWKNGMLVFRSDPMDEVVKKMSRWYNAKITLQDSELRTYCYRGTFKDETLDEVLRLLKMTSPIDYKEKQRKKLPDGTFAQREITLFLKPGYTQNN